MTRTGMNEQKRAALYARVSTLAAQNPEMQLTELREYAARRGWKVVEEYVDRMSGVRESRPALNRMMNDARRRKFDVIVVWKIDRFGRSLKHLVNALAELDALGVDFVSLRDNLDLGTPAGRLMFQIIGAMAEFERSLIQERVRAGLRNAKQKGKRLGRPPAVLDAARIAALRDSGATWRAISRQLGLGIGTVYNALRRRSENPRPAPASVHSQVPDSTLQVADRSLTKKRSVNT
jgi:DNA invertase Pin-like site-specific DNA recombinase